MNELEDFNKDKSKLLLNEVNEAIRMANLELKENIKDKNGKLVIHEIDDIKDKIKDD